MSYYNIKLTQDDAYIKEAPAASAIIPGHLVETTSAGKVQVHSGGAKASKTFALENIPSAGDINLAYAANDSARYGDFRSGSNVYALVAIAAPAIALNDDLESAGDGSLRKAVGAAVTIAGGDADGSLTFTANETGPNGNDIQIILVTPTGSPSVAVDGLTITITPDDTTPTATEVIAQVAASVAASNLITATSPGTGATAPGTSAGVSLAGGTQVVARATEAVDNSGGATAVRIIAEVK